GLRVLLDQRVGWIAFDAGRTDRPALLRAHAGDSIQSAAARGVGTGDQAPSAPAVLLDETLGVARHVVTADGPTLAGARAGHAGERVVAFGGWTGTGDDAPRAVRILLDQRLLVGCVVADRPAVTGVHAGESVEPAAVAVGGTGTGDDGPGSRRVLLDQGAQGGAAAALGTDGPTVARAHEVTPESEPPAEGLGLETPLQPVPVCCSIRGVPALSSAPTAQARVGNGGGRPAPRRGQGESRRRDRLACHLGRLRGQVELGRPIRPHHLVALEEVERGH